LEDALVTEMIQFAAFVRNQKLLTDTLKESAELVMYKLLTSLNLSQTFPNVEIGLRIYLCMMVSNASSKRSFSKLGIVIGELRSSMEQERLSMLTLMSIEHQLQCCAALTSPTRSKYMRLLRLEKQKYK